MSRFHVLIVAGIAVAFVGCGKKEKVSQQTLVPEGMRQTTVTETPATTDTAMSRVAEAESTAQAAMTTMPSMPASAGQMEPPAERAAESTPPPPSRTPPPSPPARTSRPATGSPNLAGGGTGVYVVQVGSFRQATYAEDRAEALRRAGYTARVEVADVDGVTYRRVIVPGLASLDDARQVAGRIEGDLGFATLVRKQ